MNAITKEIWDWVKTFAIVIIIVLIVRTFFFANYMVHGESMMPTIESGERLIINKISYQIFEPDRHDLIVFHATEESDYIKRVIGLPGDEIRYEDNTLYINDEPTPEPYLDDDYNGEITGDFTLEELTPTAEQFVPEDHLFVLGDNRHNSLDSRQIGFIPYEDVVGKANIRYWPLSEFTIIN
ncbi:signal peptidase I [Geomicrobium halophilum]|uniref:Signal peptidase I n=1 Tax=Geomicrobium halophilum TaxID=549000 RepID=A0A841PTF1_9BACL|nr:signal peptidase I [Geomicrobium halophilum]MBB6449581.1 signal peptidase I [Geomicrobium halophilum]